MGGRGGGSTRSMRRLRRQKYDRDIMVRESAPDVPDAAARQDTQSRDGGSPPQPLRLAPLAAPAARSGHRCPVPQPKPHNLGHLLSESYFMRPPNI